MLAEQSSSPSGHTPWLRLQAGLARFSARAAALSMALSVLISAPVRAEDSLPTLSGTWQASTMHNNWNVGYWGPECGDKPGGLGDSAGQATVIQQGGELWIKGPTRTYSTSQCWASFPGLTVVSHLGGKRGWTTVCRTPAGADESITVTTRVTATDNYINFDEVSEHQRQLRRKKACVATTRRTRFFRLVRRDGEPLPSPSADPGSDLVAGAEATDAGGVARAEAPPIPDPERATERAGCAEPGPPARLEVSPSRKLIRPGEEFQFRAVVLDAAGCRLVVAPTWSQAEVKPGLEFAAGGRVRVADSAAEGEYPLTAAVEGRGARVVLEVVSNERFEALLKRGDFDAHGESGKAIATIASGSIRAGSAVAEDKSQLKKRVFIAVVGALAVLLASVGLVLVLRSRRRRGQKAEAQRQGSPPGGAPVVGTVCPTCGAEYPPGTIYCRLDGNRLAPARDEGDYAARGGVCPVCGQGFDPGVTVCPRHGEPLIPPAVYAAARGAARAALKICPICGKQYPGSAEFCGSDGAQLVPVN